MIKDKDFFYKLLELYKGTQSDLCREMGWSRQKFNHYKNVKPGNFPIRYLPLLIYASGVEEEDVMDLIWKYYGNELE